MSDDPRKHSAYKKGHKAYPGGDVTCLGLDTPERSSIGKTAWWLGWLDARFDEKWATSNRLITRQPERG